MHVLEVLWFQDFRGRNGLLQLLGRKHEVGLIFGVIKLHAIRALVEVGVLFTLPYFAPRSVE
jgi:hypothetical protein